jgi:hypothetical protein
MQIVCGTVHQPFSADCGQFSVKCGRRDSWIGMSDFCFLGNVMQKVYKSNPVGFSD